MKYAVSTHCSLLPDGEFYIGKQEFFGHTLGMAVSMDFNQTLLKEINIRFLYTILDFLLDCISLLPLLYKNSLASREYFGQ